MDDSIDIQDFRTYLLNQAVGAVSSRAVWGMTAPAWSLRACALMSLLIYAELTQSCLKEAGPKPWQNQSRKPIT